ncbi:MAG TPA: hypothetical protein VL263_19685 [Vicinamibacterales bacterium]|nr:hypothetical protein [Vicinamibacterales bacterium]
MILYRCFAWDERARPDAADGPLWFPRSYQGDGRHDNPELYACLYLADRPLSCVVEQLARFRTQRLTAGLLRRRGLPLAIAEIELDPAAELIDLDDPQVLATHQLRPSAIATRDRHVTQPQARRLFRNRRAAAGLRWWSTYEALWANVTVFDRAGPKLRLAALRALTLDDPAVSDAAQFFAMQVGEKALAARPSERA